MKRVRGGSGIGDAIYLRPIVEHLIRSGEEVTVCSDYSDVFIGTGATVEPFSRLNIDVLGHYSGARDNAQTTQYEDVCRSAGVSVPLSFDWKVQSDGPLLPRLKSAAAGRPVVVIHGGRVPMGRTDGVGYELLPERRAFELIVAALDDCYLVRVGKGQSLYELPVHLDLNDRTSVSDLFDIFSVCDGVVAQVSFAVPLAEAFDKPLLAAWSSRGLVSSTPFVRQITPKKIFCKPTDSFVMDDWPAKQIQGAARAFLKV